MIYGMKKNCNGCRALTTSNSMALCELGYGIEPAQEIYFKVVAYKPREACYKPKTYEALFEAKELRKNK